MSNNNTTTYMPLDDTFAKQRAFSHSDIVTHRIGIDNVSCLKVTSSASFKKIWETMLDTEARAAKRKKRCLVHDGAGGFITCPGTLSCAKCEKRLEFGFSTNRPLSWEKLTKAEHDGDRVKDFEGKYLSEKDIIALATLDQILDFLKIFSSKHYDIIFLMMYHRYSIKEISEDMRLPYSTAKDTVTRVRIIVQQYVGPDFR